MAQPQPTRNIVDRLVAWWSPERAVRRAHSRRILAYYEAAQQSRLNKNRRATGGPDTDIQRAGASLRQIARHLEQNHDLALGVLNTLVANIVGDTGIGVEPQPRRADGTINDALARQLMELWNTWRQRPEVTRQHDWPSAERLLARSWCRDGDVFAQMITGTVPGLTHGTDVPFSVEMLEADYVPQDYTQDSPAIIRQGVEFNAWGAPVAYHVSKVDPGELLSVTRAQLKRIPADRMLHLKNVHRIRQVRGVTVFASVLNRFDDLKDYEESERIAAKIAASMAAYIRKGAPDLYDPQAHADAPQRAMKFRPGMVFDDLQPGEDIGTIDTNRPNTNLLNYRNGQLRAIAAGVGPTYSSIARTYDGTYSAQRQELVEGRVMYDVLSAEFVSRVTRPVYEAFVRACVAGGAITVPADMRPGTLLDATYMAPAMPWIDPRKEAEAWALMEDRAYMSGPEIIRKRGANPMDVLEQQGRWLREKAAEGVPINAAVAAQPAAPAPDDDTT